MYVSSTLYKLLYKVWYLCTHVYIHVSKCITHSVQLCVNKSAPDMGHISTHLGPLSDTFVHIV